MPQHGFIMPWHEEHPIQKPESNMPWHEEHPIQKPESNMPQHALTMPQHAKVGLIA